MQKAIYILLTVLYVIGLIGINSTYVDFFKQISPLQILSCSFLVFAFAKDQKTLFLKLLIVSVLGFAIELIGVSKGFPFGDYFYGANLGPKLWGVPLVIAINWSILIYSAKLISTRLTKNSFIQAFITATLIVVLDFFIERVAMDLDFWHWTNGIAPIKNYCSWFLIGFSCSYVFNKIESNFLAELNFALMLVFFILL